MPHFEIITGRLHHCGKIARRLRAEQKNAVIGLGADVHVGLVSAFHDSCWCRTWLVDGQVAAVAGIAATMLSDHGRIWLAASELATKYPIAFVKSCRAELATMGTIKRQLFTTLLPDDLKAERFALFLGFENEGTTRYGERDLKVLRYDLRWAEAA